MSFKSNPFQTVAPLMIGLVLSGCNTAGTSSAQELAHKPAGEIVKTSKPGAAVNITQVQEDVLSDGVTRRISLLLSDGYPSGLLRVRLETSGDAVLQSSSGEMIFDMSGDRSHSVTAFVRPNSDGQHFLNVTSIAEFEPGQVARSFQAVPIYVNVTAKTYDHDQIGQEKPTDAGVIVFEAEETIVPSE